jgi:hypothetical protein
MIYIILIFLSIFLTLYEIKGLNKAITYGDAILVFIGFIFLLRVLLKGKLVVNNYIKITFIFLLLILISAVINFSIGNGEFQHIYKIQCLSFVTYLISFNIFIKYPQFKKYLLQCFIFLSFLFLYKTTPELLTTWSSTIEGFTSFQVFKSNLNLNIWGFIILLFIHYFLYQYYYVNKNKISLLYAILLIPFIVISFSRAAYSFLLVTIFLYAILIDNITYAKIFLYIIILLFLLFLIIIIFKIFEIPDIALDFFNEKKINTKDDIISIRLFEIHVSPIENFLLNSTLLEYLIGSQKNSQHSIISHNIVFYGFLGFLLHIYRGISLVAYIYKSHFSENRKIYYITLSLIIIVYVNDVVTNITNFVPFVSYSYSLLLAVYTSTENKKLLESKNQNKFEIK